MTEDSKLSIPDAGLIVREHEPANLESPFNRLTDRLTPTNLFYIRSHFPVPALNPHTHRLSISGNVRNPFSLSYEELKAMPSKTRAVTLECAGNGRIFLSPPAQGVQWHLGAVGTAEWTGVLLSDLLQRAHLNPEVCELILEGMDKGFAREPTLAVPIKYARSLPVAKVNDVLIAYRMNGEDLPPEHGFPLRAVVSGYYGMASVKWLSCIRAVPKPFQGYFQTSDYSYWSQDEDGNPERWPLQHVAVKSQIARPLAHEVIAAGKMYRVFGAAWTAANHVQSVEVSDDNGHSWNLAHFLDPPETFLWRRWHFDWQVPVAPGNYSLQSRAIDSEGAIQPAMHDAHYGSYRIHHVLSVPVTVRG